MLKGSQLGDERARALPTSPTARPKNARLTPHLPGMRRGPRSRGGRGWTWGTRARGGRAQGRAEPRAPRPKGRPRRRQPLLGEARVEGGRAPGSAGPPSRTRPARVSRRPRRRAKAGRAQALLLDGVDSPLERSDPPDPVARTSPREGKAHAPEGFREGLSFRGVGIEEGVVRVEEDGSDPLQVWLLRAVRDETALQVVGRDPHRDPVPPDHSDPELPHLPVQAGEDLVVLAALHLVVPPGQHFSHNTLKLNEIVLAHPPSIPLGSPLGARETLH